MLISQSWKQLLTILKDPHTINGLFVIYCDFKAQFYNHKRLLILMKARLQMDSEEKKLKNGRDQQTK